MSLDVDIRSTDGSATGTVSLDATHFGIEPHLAVLHQVVTAQLAAARSGTQSTKTRAEVSGGGKKPFKQKGTGRARQGSERAPHFTGGGIALGPKPRSYKQRTPRKMISLALRSALSDRAAEDRIVVVDAWAWSEPSTKAARAALAALGITGKALVVLSREDEDAYKSFRNLPEVQVMLAGELNAYDVLCNDWIVFTGATLPGRTDPEGETPVSLGVTRTAPPAEPAAPTAPAGESDATDAVSPEPAASEPEPSAEAALSPEAAISPEAEIAVDDAEEAQ
jgi:large subunit ribosomal protein L4